MTALSFWNEPAPPPVPVPDLPYREGVDLVRAQLRADHLARTFIYDLSAALHMALIGALEETAANQNEHPAVGTHGFEAASFEPEPHDGFYTYHGSIDTPYVSEFLNMVALRWLALNGR